MPKRHDTPVPAGNLPGPTRHAIVSAGVSWVLVCAAACHFAGCQPARHRQAADKAAYKAIQQFQELALGKSDPFTVEPPVIGRILAHICERHAAGPICSLQRRNRAVQFEPGAREDTHTRVLESLFDAGYPQWYPPPNLGRSGI